MDTAVPYISRSQAYGSLMASMPDPCRLNPAVHKNLSHMLFTSYAIAYTYGTTHSKYVSALCTCTAAVCVETAVNKLVIHHKHISSVCSLYMQFQVCISFECKQMKLETLHCIATRFQNFDKTNYFVKTRTLL